MSQYKDKYLKYKKKYLDLKRQYREISFNDSSQLAEFVDRVENMDNLKNNKMKGGTYGFEDVKKIYPLKTYNLESFVGLLDTIDRLESFLLEDEYGLTQIQELVGKIHAQIDSGKIPATSLEKLLSKVQASHPELSGEITIRNNENPFGLYSGPSLETIGLLGKKSDRNPKKDRASKLTYVNTNSYSSELKRAMEEQMEWKKYYQQINFILGKFLYTHHMYVDELMGAISRKFGMDEESTLSKMGFVRSLNYLDSEGVSMQSVGSHYDMTVFTILMQDGADALRVQKNGEWYKVHLPKGKILIQFGYFAQLLSNGHIEPMYHAVGTVSGRRHVMVYFTHTNKQTFTFSSPLEHKGKGMTKQEALDAEKEEGNIFANAFENANSVATIQKLNNIVSNALKQPEADEPVKQMSRL